MSAQEFLFMKLARELYGSSWVAVVAILGAIYAVCYIRREWWCFQRTWVFVVNGIVLLVCAAALAGFLWAHLGSLGDCPNCGEKVTEDYCTSCGFEAIAPVPTCPCCGTECYIAFCGSCGASMPD